VSYPRTTVALALVVALALLVAGCGGGTDVDFTKASETVRASLESKREGFGAPIENVDCPKGVAVDPGTYFECTVRYPDGKVAYALLKIRNAEADLSLESLSRHPAERQVIH
jgi:chromosome condensin MukBEF MukE localization factor